MFSASIARTDAAKLDARAVQYDRYTNMFVFMGAHDDTWDFAVMQITLEAALKTRYKQQMEEATVKECLNIINFKTFKYLRSKEHAEKTTHPSVLPCSMVVKQTRLKGRTLAMEKLVLHKRPPYQPNALPALWQDFPDSEHGRGLHGTYPHTAHENEHPSL